MYFDLYDANVNAWVNVYSKTIREDVSLTPREHPEDARKHKGGGTREQNTHNEVHAVQLIYFEGADPPEAMSGLGPRKFAACKTWETEGGR